MEVNPTLQVICTKSIGAITWSALANQLYPSDLLLECARNTVVKAILSHKQIFSNFSVIYVTNSLKKLYT